MFAAAALLATSCIYDGLETPAPDEQSRVSFTLDLEGAIATRAISDGKSVDKLFYSIYKVEENENGEEIAVLQKFVGSDEYGRGVKNDFVSGETVTVSLAKEQTYRAVFWAQDADCNAYNTKDLTNVQIDYASAANNDENRDAFCAVTEFVADAGVTCDVVLRRPFAQVNVGVVQSDWDQAVASGVTVKESSVVIKNAATSLNLLTGAVGPETEDVEVSYTAAAIPAETLYVETDETQDGKEAYVWLSMSYILVADHNEVAGENGMLGDESATLESAEFTFVPENGTNIVLSDGLTNIPVQRNWRTNILGTILAGNVDFNITIDPAYYNDYVVDPDLVTVATGVKYDNKDTYYIEEAAGMQWVSENVATLDGFAGKTIKLTDDIDLGKGVDQNGETITTAPIGRSDKIVKTPFKGIFDGDGHSVKNLYQNGWDLDYESGKWGALGLFGKVEDATVKNVTLDGFELRVEGGNVGGVAGNAAGDCVFENITVKNSILCSYNNGVAGILGWPEEGNYIFKDIVIESDVTIAAFWGTYDAALSGVMAEAYADGSTYHFEDIVVNCKLDAFNDVISNYKWYLYRLSGMLVGNVEATQKIGDMTYPNPAGCNITCKNVTVNYGDWMNYHYCVPNDNNQGNYRIEPGYSYGGIPEDFDHTTCANAERCNILLPFNQLFGGGKGVAGLSEYDGVTVNYPDSYVSE